MSFDNDTVLTGSGDGCVRIVSILPNRLLGVLGTHGDDDAIEAMALSGDRRALATVAHDGCVQLWNLASLHDDSEGDDEDAGDVDVADASAEAIAGAQAERAALRLCCAAN